MTQKKKIENKKNIMNAFFRIASILLAFLIMGTIFYFSSQDSKESGSLSTEVYQFLKSRGIVFVVPIRKVAHFTEYIFLGISIAFVSVAFRWPFKFLLSLIYCIAYAFTDESHQMFVAGRGPSLFDVAIDSAGAFSGIFIFFLIVFIFKAILFIFHYIISHIKIGRSKK